jgi:chlorobactene glucosyltransferase
MTEYSRRPVSVIIPARNEEANIARVVRSLALQDDIFEILVVDDQSTDGTGGILGALKSRIPTLRVVRVESLPQGWFGKTHALAVGAAAARAQWLLFTDADTEHLPGSLHELLLRAESEHVDLLSLSPGQVTLTWWERAVIPTIYVWLSRQFRFEDVNDPASPAAAANGQYILIRREVYCKIGGHEAVRQEMLEDVALAARVKASGGRLLFIPGSTWVRTRMYRTFSEIWEGWTKNLYLLAGKNIWSILGALARVWLVDLLPAAALVTFILAIVFSWVRWKAGIVVVVISIGWLLWRRTRFGAAIAKLGFERSLADYQIPGLLLFCLLLLNSAWTHRRGGKVKWRGRTYQGVSA